MSYQDFTTYTETDAASDLTVSANSITADTVRRDAVCRVSKDFGASYFGDVDFDFDTQVTAEQDTGLIGVVTLTNTLGSYHDHYYAIDNLSAFWVYWYYTTSGWDLYLVDFTQSGDPTDYARWTSVRPGKKYCRLKRSGSTWTLKIYSDASRTTLEDTLTVAGSSTAFRYLQCATGRGNAGSSPTISATIGNLDIEPLLSELSDSSSADDSVSAFSLTDSITDACGISDVIDGYDFSGISPDQSVGANDSVNAEAEISAIESDISGVADIVLGGSEILVYASDTCGGGDTADAFNWTDWIAENLDKSIVRYYCTITGEADGTTDIEIPISSFQARKQNGNSTYLSVVIPGVAYADQIDARSNGDIVIDMAYLIDGIESQREEIVRAELEQINIQEGPNSRSISLIGHKDQTFVAKESRLYNPIYKARTDGALSYRFAVPDLWLNPGDTAQVDDDEFTVDTVIYMVSSGGQTTMEVQESA